MQKSATSQDARRSSDIDLLIQESERVLQEGSLMTAKIQSICAASNLVIPSPCSDRSLLSPLHSNIKESNTYESICSPLKTPDAAVSSESRCSTLSSAGGHSSSVRSKGRVQKTNFLTLIKANGGSTTSFPLTQACHVLGRSPSCDFQIDFPSVSWEHVKIRIDENNSAWLVKCNPNDEVLLNDEPVEGTTSIQLLDSDIIRIGGRRFQFTCSFEATKAWRMSCSPSTPTASVPAGEQEASPAAKESASPQLVSPPAAAADGNVSALVEEEEECGEREAAPWITFLDGSPSPTSEARLSERARYNATVYTPSMHMTAEERLECSSLAPSAGPSGEDSLHLSHLLSSLTHVTDADPSPGAEDGGEGEVAFVPVRSSRGRYSRAALSPPAAGSLQDMYDLPPTAEFEQEEEGRETAGVAAVKSLRAAYNRFVHSPSMGLSESELRALRLAAQMPPHPLPHSLPPPAPMPGSRGGEVGLVPAAEFRSIYRKALAAAAQSPQDAAATADELAALRVAAGLSGADGGEEEEEEGWHVGVVPLGLALASSAADIFCILPSSPTAELPSPTAELLRHTAAAAQAEAEALEEQVTVPHHSAAGEQVIPGVAAASAVPAALVAPAAEDKDYECMSAAGVEEEEEPLAVAAKESEGLAAEEEIDGLAVVVEETEDTTLAVVEEEEHGDMTAAAEEKKGLAAVAEENEDVTAEEENVSVGVSEEKEGTGVWEQGLGAGPGPLAAAPSAAAAAVEDMAGVQQDKECRGVGAEEVGVSEACAAAGDIGVEAGETVGSLRRRRISAVVVLARDEISRRLQAASGPRPGMLGRAAAAAAWVVEWACGRILSYLA